MQLIGRNDVCEWDAAGGVCGKPSLIALLVLSMSDLASSVTMVEARLSLAWSTQGECLLGVRLARYLCIKYPGSSPKFILTWGSPPSRLHRTANPKGATTTGPDATPPPNYLPNLAGGGGGGGGSAGGWVGGGVYWQLGGGGGLRATHYYHMHTSRGWGCLGAWGYRCMYAIIAISCLCQEESLKGLKDERHSTPFT